MHTESAPDPYAKDPLPTAASAVAADAEDDVLPRGVARPRALQLLAAAAQHHGVVLGQLGIVERVDRGGAVVRGDVTHVLVDLRNRLARRGLLRVLRGNDGDRTWRRRRAEGAGR